MTSEAVGAIGFVLLIVFLLIGMPVGISMALLGITGTLCLIGMKGSLAIAGMVPYAEILKYTLSCVPLFIFMGAICANSNIAPLLYKTAYKWFGHLPGGLADATVAACAGFAAISGSSLAGAATMGAMAIPEMDRYNYDKRFSAGTVAAGGTLAILIPPSLAFILYGGMTETSVGKLFIAGFIPGILLSLLYIAAIIIRVKLNPAIAPSVERQSFGNMLRALPGVLPTLILFVVVIGGIYSGLFTPTEAGGFGAFGALVIAIASRSFSKKKFATSLTETARTTGMIFLIVAGAMMYSYFLAVSKLPFALAEYAAASALPRYGVLALIAIVYFILGCVMDALAMLLLTIPIFMPVLFALGFDPIWVGVVIIVLMETALITPPVGMNVYILSGIVKDVPMEQIFKGAMPYVLCNILLILLLTLFPQIALFLPSFMK